MTRALVTGAGIRLGRAMALYLARRGYDVAVHYATSEGARTETVAEVQALGRKAVALQADLLDEAQVSACCPARPKLLGGPITCLVNNASIFEYDNIRTATRQSWDRHMDSNLRAPFVLTQAMARTGADTRDHDDAGRTRRHRADRQHGRHAGAQTDARVHVLHHRQDGPVGADPDRGTGADARDPRQCHRAGSDDAGASAKSEDHFKAQRANTVLERGANPIGHHRCAGIFSGRTCGHRAAFVRGWRPASGMADTRRFGRRIGTYSPQVLHRSRSRYLRRYKNVFFFIYLSLCTKKFTLKSMP